MRPVREGENPINARVGARIPNPIDDDNENLYDNVLWNNLRQRLAGSNENDAIVQSAGRSFSPLVENGWFVMDGISYTLEICVDFAQGFAKESFSLLSASRGEIKIPSVGGGRIERVAVPSYGAQISIITGAGIDTTSSIKSFTFTSGGSIFLQDGLHPHEPQLKTCAIQKLEDGSLAYSDCERSVKGPSGAKAPFESFVYYSRWICRKHMRMSFECERERGNIT